MIDLLCLLEFYNTYDHDDVYHSMAEKLIQDFHNVGHLNMQELAEYLFISTSTLYRFVKMFSYDNHGQMRASWAMFLERYMSGGRYIPLHTMPCGSLQNYGDYMISRITKLYEEVSDAVIHQLTTALLDAEEIIFVGMPMPSAVWRLQVELVLLGKKTSAFLDPKHQQAAAYNATANSLIFLVQYMPEESGFYLDIARSAKERGIKTAAITNMPISPTLQFVDTPATFHGDLLESDLMLIEFMLNMIGHLLNQRILHAKQLPSFSSV